MMTQKGVKQSRQSVEPLHLDNLPDNVIDAILMCLPLRDAGRTSVLSKKWRYNWCRLPHLTLDETLWEELEDVGDPTIKFTNIVCNLLTYHPGPITKFTLSILGLENLPLIDNLVYFLSRNGIQHLDLHASSYRLPSSFFTCSQMRHLTLYSCVIHPPLNFKGFDRLISLELLRVNSASSQVLESFISHCPMLEQLVLHIPGVIDHIKISAPKLRSFSYTGYVNRICLKNCPLVVKLSLVDIGSDLMAQACNRARFLESYPALEHLHLGYYSGKFLAGGTSEVPKRLPYALNCLKHLSISLGDVLDISCALCLIRSSPYLQNIELQVFRGTSWSNEIPFLEALLVESCSDMTFNHLRSVKIIDISGAKPEMQLIELLLAKAPVLVTMLIRELRRPFDLRSNSFLEALTTSVKVLREITRFRRASPIAEVVYS